MDEKKFSFKEALEFGFAATKNNLSFLIKLVILAGVLVFLPDVLAASFRKSAPILSSLIKFGSWIASIFAAMMITKISLMFIDGETPLYSDVKLCLPLFGNFISGMIIYTLIIFGGLLVLIIPGIILGIKYKYIPYLIIDQSLSPVEALHMSDKITSGAKTDLFFFDLLLTLINLGGLLCLFVGIFFTIPVTWIAAAYVYRHLLSVTQEQGNM